MKFLGNHRP